MYKKSLTVSLQVMLYLAIIQLVIYGRFRIKKSCQKKLDMSESFGIILPNVI